MQKILRTIKRELLEIIPPTIFFFVAFNVITYTKGLMLDTVLSFPASSRLR
jgi:hypothetical protein